MLNFLFKWMEKQAPRELLRSLYFYESGSRLLTNTAFSIVAVISGAEDRLATSTQQRTCSCLAKRCWKTHREAQPQTSDATKSLALWYWLLNFLSPNAVQLDQQPHSCLASETTPHSPSGWKSWVTAPRCSKHFDVEELPGDALLLTAASPRWPGGPKSLVKLIIRVRIAWFFLVIRSYPPFRAQILLWKSPFPLSLSTWQSFGLKEGKGFVSAITTTMSTLSQTSWTQSKCSS